MRKKKKRKRRKRKKVTMNKRKNVNNHILSLFSESAPPSFLSLSLSLFN